MFTSKHGYVCYNARLSIMVHIVEKLRAVLTVYLVSVQRFVFNRRTVALVILLAFVSSEIAPIATRGYFDLNLLSAGPGDEGSGGEADPLLDLEIDALAEKLANGGEGAAHPMDAWNLLDGRPLTALWDVSQYEIDPRTAEDATEAERLAIVAEHIKASETVEPIRDLKAKAREKKKLTRSLMNIRYSELRFQLQSLDGDVLSETNARSNYVAADSSSGRKQLIISHGVTLLHRLALPINQVAFFDNKILVLEENGDLRYYDLDLFGLDLGRTEIPLFSFPTDKKVRSISIDKNKKVNVVYEDGTSKGFSGDAFRFVSIPQEGALNAYTNMLEATRVKNGSADANFKMRSMSMLESIRASFDAFTEHAVAMQGDGDEDGRVDTDALTTLLDNVHAAQKNNLELGPILGSYEKAEISNQAFLRRMPAIRQGIASQREFFFKLSKFVTQMRLPIANRTATVIESFKMLAAKKIYRDNSKGNDPGISGADVVRNIANTRFAKVGLSIGSASVLYYMAPEASIDFVSTIGTYLLNIGKVFAHAASQTFAIFNPMAFPTIYERYVASGRWMKVVTGVSCYFALTLAFYAVPHVSINTVALTRDLWKSGTLQKAARASIITALNFARLGIKPTAVRQMWGEVKDEVIQRERTVQEEYNTLLAKDMAGEHSEVKYTSEQNEHLSKILDGLRAEQNLQSQEQSSIKTVGQAAKHFMWGDANFLRTTRHIHTNVYRVVFAVRSFALFARTAVLMVYYPKIFNSIAFSPDAFVKPSLYNGLMVPVWSRLALWNPFYRRLYYSQDAALRKQWESKILRVEEMLHEAAALESFKAACRNTPEFEDFKVFASAPLDSYRSTGVWALRKKQRSFYIRHSDQTYKLAMRKFLSRFLSDADLTRVDQMSDLELKTLTLGKMEQFGSFTLEDAHSLVREVATPDVAKGAREFANESFNLERTVTETRTKLFSNLEGMLAVKRLRSVSRGLEDPQAVARAARAAKAALFVDLPMQLMLYFPLLAGVDGGPNQAVRDQFWGDDSAFYLSRNVFFNSYLMTSVALGFMAAIPMRLQMNELHAGEFGKVPVDGDWTFMKWYMYQLRDPKNSIMENYKHMSKIWWANMPGYFAWVLATQPMSLGRVDLDSFAAHYMIGYGIPFDTGAQATMEEAFDLASSFDLRKVPKEYWHHPMTAQYLNEIMQKRRNRAALGFKLFENVWETLRGNLQMTSHPAIGSRALVRAVLGDRITSTIVDRVLDPLANFSANHGMAPVAAMARGCRTFLTNRDTGL